MSPSEDAAPTITEVEEADFADFVAALRGLARDLGDRFRATEESLEAALFGPARFAVAHLARVGREVAGAVFAQPYFSTVGGGAGVYVSDLWVAPAHRRRTLGRSLLARAAQDGAARWDARVLKLSVYADNERALDFYARMGFTQLERDRSVILAGSDFAALTNGEFA